MKNPRTATPRHGQSSPSETEFGVLSLATHTVSAPPAPQSNTAAPRAKRGVSTIENRRFSPDDRGFLPTFRAYARAAKNALHMARLCATRKMTVHAARRSYDALVDRDWMRQQLEAFYGRPA